MSWGLPAEVVRQQLLASGAGPASLPQPAGAMADVSLPAGGACGAGDLERERTDPLVLWAVAVGPKFHPTTPRTEAPHERGSSGFLVVVGRITKSGALGSQALWPPSDGSQIWTEEGSTSQQAAAKAGTSAWRAEVLPARPHCGAGALLTFLSSPPARVLWVPRRHPQVCVL